VRGDALWSATIILAERKHVEAVRVQHRHHAVGRGPDRNCCSAALEDLGHVPDDGRGASPSSSGSAAKIGVSLLRPAMTICAPDLNASWIGSPPITSTMWVAASISASLSGAEGGKRDPNNGRRRGRPGSCQRHHTILV
jgi:hypothetical protein